MYVYMCNREVIYITVVGHFKISATVLLEFVEGYSEIHSIHHNSHYILCVKIMIFGIINIQNVFNNSLSSIQLSAK
jgi:hypothetical protein